jgi:hypothetical protein
VVAVVWRAVGRRGEVAIAIVARVIVERGYRLADAALRSGWAGPSSMQGCTGLRVFAQSDTSICASIMKTAAASVFSLGGV